MVISTESFNSICCPCGEKSHYTPQISICKKFSIRQGFYHLNTCSGKVRIRDYHSTTNSTTTSQILQSLYYRIKSSEYQNSSRILRVSRSSSSSGSSSSTGYCNHDEGLSVDTIITAILMPLLCCGFCFSVVFQLVHRCHAREKVTPSHQMIISSTMYLGAPVIAVAGYLPYVHIQT